MSSVHRLPGKPNWICFYTDHTGKRRCKSTLTSDRKEAERICDRIQEIEDKARTGRLTEDRARKVIETTVADIMDSIGAPIQRRTVEVHFTEWLKAAEVELSQGTFARYDGIVKRFLQFLGPKRRGSLAALTSSDILAYRNSLVGVVANLTVNTHLKVIRVCLEKAVKENIFDKNPARLVDNLDRKKEGKRRPFTLEELQKLITAADPEWKTMVIVGLYSGGQRLSDVANLTWGAIDLASNQISFGAQKTGRHVILPLASPLRKHLESIPQQGGVDTPLFPSLHSKVESWLSNQFYELMAKAGLVQSRAVHNKEASGYKGSGTGRGGKRRQSPITFHSLRYTATSLLKNAGVSGVVTQDIVGHESEAVSRNYTVIDMETKRSALNKLPDVTQ